MATGVENLGTMVLAAGALGTAAMGIVDGLKRWEWVDVAGYDEAIEYITPFLPAVRQACGERTDEILKAQYRDGRGGGELPKTLRQGMRIGFVALPEAAVREMAGAVGSSGPTTSSMPPGRCARPAISLMRSVRCWRSSSSPRTHGSTPAWRSPRRSTSPGKSS